MAQVDLILVIACRCRKLSGISQRQGLATPRRFNSLGNRGIHTDAYKVDNRCYNAFLWTRQFISIQQTYSEFPFNLSGLLVTPVQISGSEISTAKCDTAKDHGHHQIICVNHDPPDAISISAITGSGRRGAPAPERSAISDDSLLQFQGGAETEPIEPSSCTLNGTPTLLDFRVIQAATLIGMNWLE
jgi:hypothetical protein